VAEAAWWTAGFAVVCGLAVVSSLGPEADEVVTDVVLGLFGAGAAACGVGYRVHVLRVRREIERDGTSLRKVSDPPHRRPVCPHAGRARRAQRCRPGRTRYR
jgi:hypothetical protein